MHTEQLHTQTQAEKVPVFDEATHALMAEAQTYMQEREGQIEPYSAEEYFTMLLERGLDARKQGNYGIAAALVVRGGGDELIIFGQNNVVSGKNPHGHAEMNTVVAAREILFGGAEVLNKYIAEGKAIVRDAPHERQEHMLITSLEPCPMCTAGTVISGNINKVLVGTEDSPGGQLEESRLQVLSPVWRELAEKQGLEVAFSQSDDPEQHDTYVPGELNAMLVRLFFETKNPIDAQLGGEGVFPYQELLVIAHQAIDALAEQEETE